MTYKLGSLFDGSGGFPLSGVLCGIEPTWAAEVEPYPIAVTRSRFPKMKHLGDISKVNGADIEPVDIITFGSPCQDLSVAGKRAGLKHEANGDEETTRSGLFMEAVRIIKEMRSATNGEYPRFALWENVPGAFSSNKGEDFRIVCEELIKIVEPAAFMPAVPQKGWAYSDSYIGNGWSLAYRVFDAQYWGVPQRRRRIHLIVDFRGECAREILFEREGVRGYFAQGRTPWQVPASYAQDCSGADDREGEMGERGECGDLGGAGGGRQLDAVGFMRQLSGVEAQLEQSPTLLAAMGESGNNKPCVAYTLKVRSGCDIDSAGKSAGKGALVQTEKAATLACVQDQYLFQPTGYSMQGFGDYKESEQGSSLRACGYKAASDLAVHSVAYSFDSLASNSMKSSNPYSGCREVEVAKTLDTTDPNPSKNQGGIAIVEPTGILDNIGGQAEYGKVSRVNGTLRSAAQGAVAYVVEPRVFKADDGSTGGAVPTLVGDHNNRVTDHTALVAEPVFCLQGNGIDRSDSAGCNGRGVAEDVCYTLNTIDRPAVAFGTDVGWLSSAENQSPTLLARQYKDPHLVSYAGAVNYIVRRLTPTECARLQGFADQHGHLEQKTDLTDEEHSFWMEVRNTHAAINGKAVKDYTKSQMLTWYNKLWTDSAEYKMWGNGIALPPALYCMQGIMDVLNREEDDSWML